MNNCSNICGDGGMPSSPNDIKILLKQIKIKLELLSNDTEAKLLIHDGKIAELCRYLKDNLSNSIRCMLADMEASGELNRITKDAMDSLIASR